MNTKVAYIVYYDGHIKTIGVISEGKNFNKRLENLFKSEFNTKKVNIEYLTKLEDTDFGEECEVEVGYTDEDDAYVTDDLVTLFKTVIY